MYEELENKIKSMTAKEIILSMVDALKNPVTRIKMTTYGEIYNGICYGCAATNTICKIGNLNPMDEFESIEGFGGTTTNIKYNLYNTITLFESAIDSLRLGNIIEYNLIAEGIFATIIIPSLFHLPNITDQNYKDEKVLQAYIDLANMQPE